MGLLGATLLGGGIRQQGMIVSDRLASTDQTIFIQTVLMGSTSSALVSGNTASMVNLAPTSSLLGAMLLGDSLMGAGQITRRIGLYDSLHSGDSSAMIDNARHAVDSVLTTDVATIQVSLHGITTDQVLTSDFAIIGVFNSLSAFDQVLDTDVVVFLENLKRNITDQVLTTDAVIVTITLEAVDLVLTFDIILFTVIPFPWRLETRNGGLIVQPALQGMQQRGSLVCQPALY